MDRLFLLFGHPVHTHAHAHAHTHTYTLFSLPQIQGRECKETRQLPVSLRPRHHVRLHLQVDVTQSKPTPVKPVCGYVAPPSLYMVVSLLELFYQPYCFHVFFCKPPPTFSGSRHSMKAEEKTAYVRGITREGRARGRSQRLVSKLWLPACASGSPGGCAWQEAAGCPGAPQDPPHSLGGRFSSLTHPFKITDIL